MGTARNFASTPRASIRICGFLSTFLYHYVSEPCTSLGFIAKTETAPKLSPVKILMLVMSGFGSRSMQTQNWCLHGGLDSAIQQPLKTSLTPLERFYNRCPSSRRRGLQGGGNSDKVAVERNGAIDCRRLISRDQPVGVLSCAHKAVKAPDVIRFAIQKID
jgi:hypothetical protein